MSAGLLDPAIAGVVFAPLTFAASVAGLLWKRAIRTTGLDGPSLILHVAAGALSSSRLDWGTAMVSELSAVSGRLDRWRFSFGCVRAALLMEGPEPRPVLGVLAVALPLLALPLLYTAALAIESIGGSPYTASRWNNPDVVVVWIKVLLVSTVACMVSGVPLGLAGWLRRERIRGLAILGVGSSICVMGYFLTVMQFLSGGE
jgi:hypothetical protein